MDRNIQRIGLINVVAMLLIGVFSWWTASYAQSLSALSASIFIGLGFMVCVVSTFQMRLEARERLEKMEFDELSKAKDSSTLFSQDGDSFESKRSREQFERFFVPAFTIILLILECLAIWMIYGLSTDPRPLNVERAMVSTAFYAGFFLVFFLLGQYSASLARFENHRLIRPGGSFMLLSSFVCLIAAIVEAMAYFGILKADIMVARALSVVLGLVAVETLIALMFEIYRPRMKGQVAHLLYDSRLVGLLGQPGGIFSTVAQAIDYQFGFKVSDTWFYRFLEKAMVWIVLLQLGALSLSSTLVIVGPQEQALIERFGKPVRDAKVLESGIHFKWPWPVEKIYRHNPGQIQKINVGFIPREHESNEPSVWTMPHSDEEYNFLVASNEQVDQDAISDPNSADAMKAIPVNLINASIPVHFMIEDLVQWEYGHADGAALLQSLATREVVRYCVNVDFMDLMTAGREAAAEELQKRIQQRAEDVQLGIRVVFVGMSDIHPPIGTADDGKVAGSYEQVNNAIQQREGEILMAQAYAADVLPKAGAEATRVISQAEAYKLSRTIEASSIAARFTNQIRGFTAAPEVFTKRARLHALADSTWKARKYILGVTNTTDIITIDLEDKFHKDLMDLKVDVPDGKKDKK